MEILTSEHLTENEKIKLTQKIIENEDACLNKTLFYILNFM